MIIDLEKQRNGRSNAQRTFVIGAAYRGHRDGNWQPWRDTGEVYAIVTADGRIDALKKYLAKRADLFAQSEAWQYDNDAQRVWSVRLIDDDPHYTQLTADRLFLSPEDYLPVNVILQY